MQTVGTRLKLVRIEKKLTQEELANLIDDPKINKVRIGQYECNYRVPKDTTLKIIAKVLDTDVEWLLNGDLDNDCPEIELGKRMKLIREAKGMTRSELGKILELNNPDIRVGSYENGKKFPRMAMIKKIANALEVSWQWLITGYMDNYTYISMNNLGLIKKYELEKSNLKEDTD